MCVKCFLIIIGLSCFLEVKAQGGWWSFENRDYMFNDNFQGNFYDADNYCTNNGMQLLTLDKEKENTRLLEEFKASPLQGVFYWTSANKLRDENQWIWLTTGQPILSFHWADGEPNNENGNQNCIQTRVAADSDGWWDDVDCDISGSVICQIERDNN